MEERSKPTIGMLLDIENLYGEHSGRLTPILLSLCIGGAPILFYVYFGLYAVIPLWLFIPVEIFICIRVIMIIPGRERHRVKLYKNQLNDDYTPTAKMLNIKVIHPDGCIEYNNGKIAYLVTAFNGTTDDEVARSVQLRKFLENLLGEYINDTYILNITDSESLRNYYSKVSAFDHNDSATNFINIIDHTIQLTADTSVVQCTVYCIKGNRSDWKNIKTQIDSALKSKTARAYKTLERLSDPEAINAILNRDVDSIINISDLLRRKYATSDYATSKVLAYDLPQDQIIIQGKAAVNPIIPKQTSNSFHVKYKEEN